MFLKKMKRCIIIGLENKKGGIDRTKFTAVESIYVPMALRAPTAP